MSKTTNGSDRVNAVLSLLGGNAVLLPIRAGVKKPELQGWNRFTEKEMADPAYLARFNNGCNIGVLLGEQSHGLCTIDIDDDRFVEPFLEANPVFRTTLRTKRLKGCNFWLWVTGDYPGVSPFHHARLKNPKGEPIALGEWRATGAQTVIQGQADGIPYQCVVDAKPIKINFADIIWPDWISDPPILEEPFQYEPKSGHNLDPDKLENYHPYANGVIKCACPACRENGEDKSGNHLQIKPDGRFGCCKYPKDREHRKLIWKLAGKSIPKPESDSDSESEETPDLGSRMEIDALLAFQPEADHDVILGNRYLCRGGSCVIVGSTSVGKSSLGLQMAVLWAIGASFFGLKPVRPLKSLFLQAENDLGDMAEMFQGILKGTGLLHTNNPGAKAD